MLKKMEEYQTVVNVLRTVLMIGVMVFGFVWTTSQNKTVIELNVKEVQKDQAETHLMLKDHTADHHPDIVLAALKSHMELSGIHMSQSEMEALFVRDDLFVAWKGQMIRDYENLDLDFKNHLEDVKQ